MITELNQKVAKKIADRSEKSRILREEHAIEAIRKAVARRLELPSGDALERAIQAHQRVMEARNALRDAEFEFAAYVDDLAHSMRIG